MILIKEPHLQLGDQVNRDIHFKYQCENKFPHPVQIEAKASCGCTLVNKSFIVESNKTFELPTTLTKRPRLGKFTKSVTLNAYDKLGAGRKTLFTKNLKFTVNVK